MSQPLHPSALNWTEWKYSPDATMDMAMRLTNWQNLCERASRLRAGMSCQPLDYATNGLNNMARLLQFSDGTLWVARIAMRRSAKDSAKLGSEVATMLWILEQSSLAIPQIYAYEIDEHNSAGVPFVLMEFLPGNTVMNAAGGYEVHHGVIPKAHRLHFYRSVAECHVQMTALRLPKIGMIRRTADGAVEAGPFPDIGGPFSTATAFFEAWARHHSKFSRTPEEILDIMRGGPAQQVLRAIQAFPRRFPEVAPQVIRHDHGPFPLCHPDFLHSNIIADEDYNVLGIIDWEGACTLPLELVRFPRFLETAPRLFGPPEKFDADGWPVDEEVRERWQERRDYVDMVKSFQDPHDCTLSECLEYEKGQDLSYIMGAYDGTQMGFYDQVLDALEDVS